MLQAEDVGVGLLTKPGNAVEGQKCSASEQKGVATVSAEGVQQRIFSSSKMRSGCGRPCTMIHSQGRCKLFRSTDPPEISRPFVALALVSVSLLVLSTTRSLVAAIDCSKLGPARLARLPWTD